MADTVDFIRDNPTFHGVHWCSALEVSLRLIAWAWLWECTREAALWTPGRIRELAGAIWRHAEYVRRHLSRFSSANNHLIGEATGLVVAGCSFAGLSESRRWLEMGVSTLERELLRQTSAEGCTREQSWRYLVFVLELSGTAGACCRAFGRPLSGNFDDRLLDIVKFLRFVSGSPAVVPHIGDADDGHVPGAGPDPGANESSLRAAEC